MTGFELHMIGIGGEPMAIIFEYQLGKTKVAVDDDAYKDKNPQQLQVAEEAFYQAVLQIIRNFAENKQGEK